MTMDDALFDQRLAQFANTLIRQLEENSLLKFVKAIDHVCYRVASLADYELWTEQLARRGSLLSEAYINGRPIASFQLNHPIPLTRSFSVGVIELPAPKPGRAYEEGFEHIEAVTSCSLEVVLDTYPALSFDKSNLGAAINRDIGIKFEAGLVKFHEESLAEVIREEQRLIALRKTRWVTVVDFDDTLVHSKVQFLAAFYDALCEYFGETLNHQLFLERARPTFPEFLANFGITAELDLQKVIQLFQMKWPAYGQTVGTISGITSALSCLQSEGAEIIIWTARDLITTSDFVKHSPLRRVIRQVYAYEDAGISKPQASAALKEFCAGARVVMTGDSMADKLGAEYLQAKFLQATWVQRAQLQVVASDVCAAPFDFLNKALAYFRAR